LDTPSYTTTGVTEITICKLIQTRMFATEHIVPHPKRDCFQISLYLRKDPLTLKLVRTRNIRNCRR